MLPSLRVLGTRADGTTASVAPAYPAGIQVGDIILLHAFFHNGTTANAGTFSTPTGFTLVGRRTITVAGVVTGESALFWRRADGTETGSVTVSRTGATGNATVTTANMAVWAGCVPTGTPYEAFATWVDETPPYAVPALTTLGADREVIFWVFANDNLATTGEDANYTALVNYVDATGIDYGAYVARRDAAAAGTYTPSATAITQSAGVEGCGFTLALIGETLTAVGTSRAIRYDVAQAVGVSRAVRYDVAAPLGISRAIRYDVAAPLAVSRSLRYAVKTNVGTSRVVRWDLAGSQKLTGVGRVALAPLATPTVPTDPHYLRIQAWKANPTDAGIVRVRLYSAGSLVDVFDVTLTDAPTSTTRQIPDPSLITDYATLEVSFEGISNPAANLTARISWIRFDAPVTAAVVSATRALRWDLVAQIAASRTIRYDVATAVAASRAIRYDVFTGVGSSRVVRYDLAQTAGASRTLRYDVAAAVGASRVVRYDVARAVGISRVTLYDVFSRVGSSRVVRYDLAASVAAARLLRYDVAALAGVSRAIRWDVVGPVAVLRAIVWDVRAPLGVSRILVWEFATPIGSSRAVRYDVFTKLGASRALRWDLAQTAASVRAIRWDLRALAGDSRAIRYDVATTIGTSRVVRYDVARAVGASRVVRWDLAAPVAASRLLRWDLIGRATVGRTLRYDVRALVSVGRTLRWKVRLAGGRTGGRLGGRIYHSNDLRGPVIVQARGGGAISNPGALGGSVRSSRLGGRVTEE